MPPRPAPHTLSGLRKLSASLARLIWMSVSCTKYGPRRTYGSHHHHHHARTEAGLGRMREGRKRACRMSVKALRGTIICGTIICALGCASAAQRSTAWAPAQPPTHLEH